jgi:hypothetical protein
LRDVSYSEILPSYGLLLKLLNIQVIFLLQVKYDHVNLAFLVRTHVLLFHFYYGSLFPWHVRWWWQLEVGILARNHMYVQELQALLKAILCILNASHLVGDY